MQPVVLDCKSSLKLCDLCAKNAKIQQLCADNISASEVCSTQVDCNVLNADQGIINNLCSSGLIQGQNINANNLGANNLCAVAGTVNTLCVDNLSVGVLNNLMKWRAAATFAANSVYNLGSAVNWDLIIDDPNNNVSLSPFGYTVPIAGYYNLSVYLVSDNLNLSSPVLGNPIGILNILVNGNSVRQLQIPYLTFSQLNFGILSSLVILNAGDLVTMNYNVFALNSSSGLVPLAGTANINASGLVPGGSRFEIHYLSSMSGSGTACNVCPVISVPCGPAVISCQCPIIPGDVC